MRPRPQARWPVVALSAILALAPADTARADLLSVCKAHIAGACSGVVIGRGRISACLFSHASKLDEPCRTELEAVTERTRNNPLMPRSAKRLIGAGPAPAVPAECAADEERMCSDVDAGSQSVLACLYAHSRSLSSGCSSGIRAALR